MMQGHQRFLPPVALDSDSPAFPASLDRKELAPVTVCLEVVISETGEVQRVVPLFEAGVCGRGEPGVLEVLQAAAQDTVQRWRFDPAAICTYPDAATAEAAAGTCFEHEAHRRPVPVRLAYAFTFEMRDGKHKVASAPR
jgi:hypothetical protein